MRIPTLLIAFLSSLVSASPALAADPTALVLYTQPPADYVMALEVVALKPGNVVFSVATLPNGSRQEIPRAGIMAVIDYPPSPPGTVTEQEATAALQKITAGAQKYPQCRTKLTAASTKWNNALAFSRQAAKAVPVPSPAKSAGLDLEIDGVKYRNVVLTSFVGDEVAFSHDDGVAKIRVGRLTPTQVTALNSTSSTVRIDLSRIAKLETPSSLPPGIRVPTPGRSNEIRKGTTQPSEELEDAVKTLTEAFSAELPNFELKLNTLCRVFKLQRHDVIVAMSGLQLIMEEAGMRTRDLDHSKQAIAAAWRCIVWPLIAVEVTKDQSNPLPFKVMRAAALKEHVMYFSTKGRMHPGDETRLVSLLTTLNDREDARLSTLNASDAAKTSRVMSVGETFVLRDELMSKKDRSPKDRHDLKFALTSRTGEQLLELFSLDDFFGFEFGKSELKP